MPDFQEKYEAYSDDELAAAINQLGGEVAMGKEHKQEELNAAREEARRRDLFI